MPSGTGSSRSSWRLRWHVWRARWSLPALLARGNEATVVSVLGALNGAVAMLVVATCASWLGMPLVFPVLGPTAFILFTQPFAMAAAPRCVMLGHLAALATGLLCFEMFERAGDEPWDGPAIPWVAAFSASLALALTFIVLMRLQCLHPPACATAVVAALGELEDGRSIVGIVVAIGALTLQAACTHRAMGIMVPGWSPRQPQLFGD